MYVLIWVYFCKFYYVHNLSGLGAFSVWEGSVAQAAAQQRV